MPFVGKYRDLSLAFPIYVLLGAHPATSQSKSDRGGMAALDATARIVHSMTIKPRIPTDGFTYEDFFDANADDEHHRLHSHFELT